MRTITSETTVYKFAELSKSAQEKALDKMRESEDFTFSAECVIKDAKDIAALMGVNIENVYYPGFWSQGDGACFKGSYRYKADAVKAIASYTGNNDNELIRIAKALQDAQRKEFYKLRTIVSQRGGYYYHSDCMAFDIYRSGGLYRDFANSDDEIVESLRDFADWIYKQVKELYEWAKSDEAIKETIECNDYEFKECGSIYF